ncbi:hypothetical protein M0Q97_10700 [Candidatus Dojkabacteria bacterium]|jgi:hypothetical protein|nr:hypothetical protein [Candidatus Dojkabacteria bacterium]
MIIENFSANESQILSLINQDNNTFEKLLNNVQFSEKTLITSIESLISKKIIFFDIKNNEYKYDSKFDGEMIILDGNILLPTTIIKIPEKNLMYISRGEWYQFPINFDIRRIIWNVKIDTKTNSTLVDLIKTSVLKERKSRIIQLPEYENLKNKIVPYSDTIGLYLNTIGEEVTEVTILFKIKLEENSSVSIEHRGFSIRSEILTSELINELKLPINERNYNNIKLNKIFNFSDFIFSKNEIPVSLTDKGLTFLRITGVKKMFEFTYIKMNFTGETQILQILEFDDSNEAIEHLRNIFNGLPNMILTQNNFFVELTD